MDPFIGEVKLLPWNWAPKGWALCNGALLPIAQNSALFSLLGTQYGGNGTTTFALPDLRGRAPVSFGGGFAQGESTGTEKVTLTQTTMPGHNHNFAATSALATSNSGNGLIFANDPSDPIHFLGSGTPFPIDPSSIGIAGSGQPHQNMQPFLVMSYCIALFGVFPSRN